MYRTGPKIVTILVFVKHRYQNNIIINNNIEIIYC